MLRTTDAPLSALVSSFQVGLGALCSYNYDMEASEERSSDEHYDGAAQAAKLAHSGSRSFGATSSACRGAPRNAAVTCASWIPSFLAATYFQPCERHRHHKKNECTFFCITCGARPHSVCQHCMGAHAGHQVIQVRRYVYCDVVRACDISPYMDASGVQNYIINSAKVMFLNHRPHSKIGRANGVDICRTCHRHLREGYSYCSLACKVEALTKGESVPVGTSDGAARAASDVATAAPRLPLHAGSAGAGASGTSPRSRPYVPGTAFRSSGSSPIAAAAAAAAAAPIASSFSPRPRPAIPLASRGSSLLLAAAAFAGGATAAALDPLEMAAADASCAAMSSDRESSEPGEDRFVFGGGGGSSSPPPARAGGAATGTVRRRLPPAPRDLDDSSNGSASSRDDDCYEFNFANPPKRRRSHTITRRPSSSNGYSGTVNNAGGESEAEAAAAAATAAATLLMPFRSPPFSLLPAPPPPSGFTAAAAAVAAAASNLLFCGASEPLLAGSGGATADDLNLSRAASGSGPGAGFSSRRKQQAPQRAPSF